MAGGPVVIYLVRTLSNAYFSFRIDALEARLKDLQTERAKTIQKLKDATKYDSTLELLEKYGGSGEKRNQPKEGAQDDTSDNGQQKNGKRDRRGTGPEGSGGRINIPPPPTANIQRRPVSAPGPSPGASEHRQLSPSHMPQLQVPLMEHQPTEEFAPNAGPLPGSYSQYDMNSGPPRWYDRIMDLMLGEDEMAPKNRIVLICQKCRLVNGQAPPGTKSLSEMGAWKCMSCGTLNGEMDEGKRIIREVLGTRKSNNRARSDDRDSDLSSDVVKVENDGEGEEDTNGEEISAKEQPNLRLRNKKSQMVP